jgi:hypothetical protein
MAMLLSKHCVNINIYFARNETKTELRDRMQRMNIRSLFECIISAWPLTFDDSKCPYGSRFSWSDFIHKNIECKTELWMKMTAFWDIAPCCFRWSRPTFRRCVLPPSSGRSLSQYARLKRRSTSAILHGGIYQKVIIFKLAAWNLTRSLIAKQQCQAFSYYLWY